MSESEAEANSAPTKIYEAVHNFLANTATVDCCSMCGKGPIKRDTFLFIAEKACKRVGSPQLEFRFLKIEVHLYYIQLNPGNSNCQGKLKLLRVIGVSSYRGFGQKDYKPLIKKWFMLIHGLL